MSQVIGQVCVCVCVWGGGGGGGGGGCRNWPVMRVPLCIALRRNGTSLFCHCIQFLCHIHTLAANVMESLLLNGICVNLIGIYCFWSYVQLRNEILLISSIHHVTKLNGQTQSVLSGDRWDSREGKKVSSGVVTWSEVCLRITTLMLYAAWGFRKDYWYFFELLKGIMPQNLEKQILSGCRQMAILSEK